MVFQKNCRYKKDDSKVTRFKESIQMNKLTTTIGDHISIKLHKWDATIEGIYFI